MKIRVREYRGGDVKEAAAIWNQVVEDGEAFPQMELLTVKTGDEFFREQVEVFRQQMIWADEAGLPVIIHVRDAHDTVFEVLDGLAEAGIGMKGVFHAFSGSIETYRRIRRYGDFRVGIGGVVTYKNAGIASTVKDIPLEDILLETDSPWLTPVPYRGRRNESSYLGLIAGKIAQIKEIPVEAVDLATTAAAKALFNLT